jgi:protoporphyrin/coproporphyrin ferrochelatase
VRRYLAEFLSDPRVVALPRFVWLPILHGLVLRRRPAKSAEKYKLVWTPEGSPLAVHTARQARLLRERTGWQVDHAMRYGMPSLAAQKATDAVVVPLYPQYSESTTGSVIAMLTRPDHVVREFHSHPAYIGALASLVRGHWERNGKGEKLVMSFHGLPQRAVNRGDPYHAQCLASARLLGEALGTDSLVTFQSRFGAARWLQPYTEPTLVELARAGVRSVDVICPGFVSDCLETLEEIDIAARAAFLAAGGTRFTYIPCLNESPEWIAALAQISAGSGPSAGP